MPANPRSKPFPIPNAAFTGALLDWYARHSRDLPWRVGPVARARGERADPYRVWLSEIMLQQTTVPHAAGYFLDFTRRWPDVAALAAADDGEVMAAWAGLGYYARARNLLKCARDVSARGGFPETRDALLTLPGIGPYTSGAIAAIAFGERAPAVDGNVERVFSRLLALEGDWKAAKAVIAETVAALVPEDRPGEFAEALMDLGATVCTPRRPNCGTCPVAEACAARKAGVPERYPVKEKRAAKPKRRGHAYVLAVPGGIMVKRRPDHGLLGGMLGLPGSDWVEGEAADSAAPAAPVPADWEMAGEVRHVFTHFELTLTVWRADAAGGEAALADGQVLAGDRLSDLPTVFRKAARLALG